VVLLMRVLWRGWGRYEAGARKERGISPSEVHEALENVKTCCRV
jgi:hypothetical protein